MSAINAWTCILLVAIAILSVILVVAVIRDFRR